MKNFKLDKKEKKEILEQHKKKGLSLSEQIEDIDFEEDFGDYEGDEEAEDKAEFLSSQEPTYVGLGKKFGSFSDNDIWYDDKDYRYEGPFDFEYDEEEFDEFEPFYEKHGKDQYWFAPGEGGKKFFNTYKDLHGGPFKVRTRKNLGESDEEFIFEPGPTGMRSARSRADFQPSKREVELGTGVFGKYSEEIPPIVIRYMRKNPKLIIKRLYDIYGDKMFDYVKGGGEEI